jgi:RimJ/RimL family protein N-acetyltransferase
MQLHTERLQLREFTEADFEDVFAYESDPLVVQYVCYGPYTETECRRQLEFHISHQSAHPRKYYHLGIVLPQEKRLIGWCGLELGKQINLEDDDPLLIFNFSFLSSLSVIYVRQFCCQLCI